MTTVTTLPEHHKLLTSAIFSSVSLPVPPLETLSETVFAARASVLCTCTQRVRAGGSTGSLAIKWWREHPPPVSKVVALLDVDSVVENPKFHSNEAREAAQEIWIERRTHHGSLQLIDHGPQLTEMGKKHVAKEMHPSFSSFTAINFRMDPATALHGFHPSHFR